MKLQAEDGKMRLTDVGTVEDIFRLIQSIPSPKAEPFKQWLAKVGYERLQEIQDPSLSMDRARENASCRKFRQVRLEGSHTVSKKFLRTATDGKKQRFLRHLALSNK